MFSSAQRPAQTTARIANATAAETVRRTRLGKFMIGENSLVFRRARTVSMPSAPARMAADAMPEKQTMLDNAGNGVESIRQRSWIRNAAKRCIEDQMPAVCNKRLRRPSSSMSAARKGRGAARLADRQPVASRPNRLTSIGSGKRPSVADQLGPVGDDDHPRRGRRHDLLAQQRAAAALDQGEVGSTSSAPSMVRSSSGVSSSVDERHAELRGRARRCAPRSARL